MTVILGIRRRQLEHLEEILARRDALRRFLGQDEPCMIEEALEINRKILPVLEEYAELLEQLADVPDMMDNNPVD